ncbi:hypothetical protein [Phaffia rhodozyma]|uniref:DUF7082 domain-containing protein n=1 Tax=Phaffia rhodozyma TaxID=264483 RepID=A0A0F7SJL7_PHARH|nr:hypothetical protein [Phaffia rhodozyma]
MPFHDHTHGSSLGSSHHPIQAPSQSLSHRPSVGNITQAYSTAAPPQYNSDHSTFGHQQQQPHIHTPAFAAHEYDQQHHQSIHQQSLHPPSHHQTYRPQTLTYDTHPAGQSQPAPGSTSLPNLSPQELTPAYAHHSETIRIHSYSAAFSSTDTSSSSNPPSSSSSTSSSFSSALTPAPTVLNVNCTLIVSSSQTDNKPKIIRLCFDKLPLATHVARAPIPSDRHPASRPEDQDLILSCRLPSESERPTYNPHSVNLFCEILSRDQPGPGVVLERLWFGTFQYASNSLNHMDSQSTPASAPPYQTSFPNPSVVNVHTDPHPSSSTYSSRPPSRTLKTRHSWSPISQSNIQRQQQQQQQQHYQQHQQHQHQHQQQQPHYQSHDRFEFSPIGGPDEQGEYLNVSSDAERLNTIDPHAYSSDGQSTYTYTPDSIEQSQSQTQPQLHSQPPLVLQPVAPQPARYNIHPTHQSASQTMFYRPVLSNLGQSKHDHQVHQVYPHQQPQPSYLYPNTQAQVGPTPSPINFRQTRVAPRDKDRPLNYGTGVHSAAAGGGRKAALEVYGELSMMAIGWSDEEWQTSRRLVQFWRKVEGQTIHVTFSPITQAQYVDSSIVISCIWREDTNDCYVTSVDAIFLLEALIGGRFSVEEKNRIRRNLERCKPETMSKSKPDTEAFFRLIMGFPRPKPRNIEKDVKVFKWANFQEALKKSVSKYFINEQTEQAKPTDRMGPPSSACRILYLSP